MPLSDSGLFRAGLVGIDEIVAGTCRRLLTVVWFGLAGLAPASATDARLSELQDLLYREPARAESLVAAAVTEGWLDPTTGHVVLAKALYQRNEFNASMTELAMAEPLTSPQEQPLVYAQIRSLAAQNYYRMGSMDQAMIAAREAQRAIENQPDPALLAQVFNIIAAVHLASGEREEARRNFELSLAGFKEVGSRPDIAKLHNNLGVLYIEDQNLEAAEPHLLASLTLARELRRSTTIIANLVNLSELYAKRGRLAESKSAVDDCFAAAAEANDQSSLVWCHEAASFQLKTEGKLDEAVAQSRQALTYAEKFGLQQHIVDSARALAIMLTGLAQHEQAAAMNDKAFVTMDAIRDQLLKLRLQQSNALIDFERAKSELLALQLRNEFQQGLQRMLLLGLVVLLPMLLISLWLLRSRSRVVRALAEANSNNERLALTDSLTGLPNRRCFLQAIAVESDAVARGKADFCTLLLDVDHFKTINDRHGHKTGDEVLVQIAKALKSQLGPGDSAARWGGEEFVVLLAEATIERAFAFANDLKTLLADQAATNLPAITVSVGLVAANGRPPDRVLAAADAAMYQAKRDGRNRACTEPVAASESQSHQGSQGPGSSPY